MTDDSADTPDKPTPLRAHRLRDLGLSPEELENLNPARNVAALVNIDPQKNINAAMRDALLKSNEVAKGFEVRSDLIRLAAADIQARPSRHESSAMRALTDVHDARRAAEQAQIAREERALTIAQSALDAQRALLEQQQALVAEQLRQGSDAVVDRRIQYAVLVVAVLALVAAVAIPVAVSTDSVWWTLLAGTAAILIPSVAAAGLVRSKTSSDGGAP